MAMVLLSETKRNCSGCCCRQLDSFLTMVRGKNRRSCRNAAGRNTRLSGDRGRAWHCCTTWAGVGLLMGLFAPPGKHDSWYWLDVFSVPEMSPWMSGLLLQPCGAGYSRRVIGVFLCPNASYPSWLCTT